MNILLNGVGRIGKAIVRICNDNTNINIVAINELNTDIENIAYSINYDSTYGRLADKYSCIDDNYIKNKNHTIKILNYTKLEDIALEKLKIDIIIDASGAKLEIIDLKKLKCKAVFLTHPNKDADINIILGVNEKQFVSKKHQIISTSSCNATALLPILKIIDDNYNIVYGDILTVHPLLNHQKVLDSGCVGNSNRDVKCNAEFGRSSLANIIPSKTTTIEACSYVLSKFNDDLISSSSLRVPTDTVGAINICLTVDKDITKERFVTLCNNYEKDQENDIVLNNTASLVSSDFKAEKFTTILDHRFTQVKHKRMIKIILWYDNEWGYASKVIDIIDKLIL